MRPIARWSRWALAAVVTVAACTADRPTAPQTAPLLSGGDPTGLLWCSPLAADSAAVQVGAAGGVVTVGPHRLEIPAGALDTAVVITARIVPDTVNRVDFGPDGLEFSRPVWLRMSYANCNLLGSLLPKRIALTSDALVILEYLPSVDSFSQQVVTGKVTHFSTYAVAW